MVARMNSLEHAARTAMSDDCFTTDPDHPPEVTGLSSTARLALIASCLTVVLLVVVGLI